MASPRHRNHSKCQRPVADPIPLTTALLQQLAAQWRKHDLPIARRLAPGLSDAEMDALVQPAGLAVPREARTWWGWHNGAHDSAIVTSGGKGFSSLERCVSLAAEMREIARDVASPYCLSSHEAEEMARGVWNWEWLPLCEDGVGGMLVIEGKVDEPKAICPVWHRAIDDSTDQAAILAPSIGALVQQWTIAVQTATGSHSERGDRWTLDRDTLPAGFDDRLL
jgi:cell wall assembly regulator SMI1